MTKVRIINEAGQHHVFVGNTDFWINTESLEHLAEEAQKAATAAKEKVIQKALFEI